MARLQQVLRETCEALRFGQSQCIPNPSGGSKENRRGAFKTAAVGVSYGGGQTVSGHAPYIVGRCSQALDSWKSQA